MLLFDLKRSRSQRTLETDLSGREYFSARSYTNWRRISDRGFAKIGYYDLLKLLLSTFLQRALHLSGDTV